MNLCVYKHKAHMLISHTFLDIYTIFLNNGIHIPVE